MNVKKVIILTILSFMMISCNNQQETMEDETKVEMTKITNQNLVNQDISNQAKDSLSEHKNVTNIHAVNTDKQLAIAIEIPHMKRFRLQKIEKELTKEMKNKFPEIDVNFSTDKKIIIELEQLERDLETTSLTKKEVDKKLKKIIGLMNEQT